MGSFGALCKISDVKIFKSLLLQFQPNLMESLEIGGGGVEPVTFIIVCMNIYFDSVMHYTCYVNVGQIKLIQIHPETRSTPENLEDCGWVLKGFPTRVGLLISQINFLWHFEVVVNINPYGAGNFKMLFRL